MTRPVHRVRRVLCTLGLALLLPLAVPVAEAEPTGIALVIGIDNYLGGRDTNACVATATELRDRLRGRGLTVETLLDPQGVALRGAIDDFAAQLSGAPSGNTLLYVCAAAVTDGTRLFVMPAGLDPRLAELQTQGVVAQALLRTLAGTGGTLYADLAVPPGVSSAPSIASLVDRLPAGLHLAVSTKAAAPLLGRRLAAGVDATWSWNAVEPALAASPGLAPGGAVAYAPVPAPPPVPRSPPPVAAPPPSPVAPKAPVPPPASPVRPAMQARASRTRNHVDERERSARVGSPRVARLQTALARLGFYGGPANGQLDGRTLEAIRAFQRKLGDAPTGVMTASEVVRLLNS